MSTANELSKAIISGDRKPRLAGHLRTFLEEDTYRSIRPCVLELKAIVRDFLLTPEPQYLPVGMCLFLGLVGSYFPQGIESDTLEEMLETGPTSAADVLSLEDWVELQTYLLQFLQSGGLSRLTIALGSMLEVRDSWQPSVISRDGESIVSAALSAAEDATVRTLPAYATLRHHHIGDLSLLQLEDGLNADTPWPHNIFTVDDLRENRREWNLRQDVMNFFHLLAAQLGILDYQVRFPFYITFRIPEAFVQPAQQYLLSWDARIGTSSLGPSSLTNIDSN